MHLFASPPWRAWNLPRDGQEPPHRRVARQGQDDQQVPRQGLHRPRLLRPCPRPGAQGRRGRSRPRLRDATTSVIDKNEKHVDAIAKAAKGADALFLATDPDREGEAISWHIAEILKERGLLKGKTLQRVVFTEITPRAIKEAMANPREIAGDLVDAQQARRALDYLVGFNLSPVLWRKVQRGLSAGRVQSPALRMIVEREEEIEAFIAREYWSIEAECAHPSQTFTAKLNKLDGKKFEQFTDHRRRDRRGSATPHRRRRQRRAARHRRGQQGTQAPSVAAVHDLDAAAGSLAQARLHHLAHHARGAEAVRRRGDRRRRHGRPDQLHAYRLGQPVGRSAERDPRRDRARLRHQARCRTSPTSTRPNPRTRRKRTKRSARPPRCARPRRSRKYLDDDGRRLYELIWKRAVASQMVPATLNTVSVDLAAGSEHSFRASGTTVIDPGFLAVYEEGKDQKTAEDEDEGRKLPADEARRPRAARPHPHRPAFHRAAAALLRSLAGQGARGIRHRPAVDVFVDHPDAAVPQIRRAREPPLPPERRRPRGRRTSSAAISPATSTTTSPPSSRTNSMRYRAARKSGCR